MRYYIDNLPRISHLISSESGQKPLSTPPSDSDSLSKSEPIEPLFIDESESEDQGEGPSIQSASTRKPTSTRATKRFSPSSYSRTTLGTHPSKDTGRFKRVRSLKQKTLLPSSPQTPHFYISVPTPSSKSKPIVKPPSPIKNFTSSSIKGLKTPIPPRFVERAVTNRGNAWTSEDDRFITETVVFELKRDRRQSVLAICGKMAEQVCVGRAIIFLKLSIILQVSYLAKFHCSILLVGSSSHYFDVEEANRPAASRHENARQCGTTQTQTERIPDLA